MVVGAAMAPQAHPSMCQAKAMKSAVNDSRQVACEDSVCSLVGWA